jgi:hypothetical protein
MRAQNGRSHAAQRKGWHREASRPSHVLHDKRSLFVKSVTSQNNFACHLCPFWQNIARSWVVDCIDLRREPRVRGDTLATARPRIRVTLCA